MPAHRVLSRSLERRDIPLGGGLARSYGAIVVGSNVDPISHVRLPDFRGTSLVVGAIKVMGAMLVPPEATVRARMDVGDARMEAHLASHGSSLYTSLAMAAHSTPPDRSYIFDQPSSYAIFTFRGSMTLDDWFSRKPFGNTLSSDSSLPQKYEEATMNLLSFSFSPTWFLSYRAFVRGIIQLIVIVRSVT
ncbi:hypothetical protein NE237_006357 [Protea cynaroides]|uniref:Uncharacterized protein n=1 Tax=Protea cynaroides TaxID=273540 RepID=A0A9Q0QV82_9MAGN|nr:hypothetical protein NE237_006357 [Protea cynaroides]